MNSHASSVKLLRARNIMNHEMIHLQISIDEVEYRTKKAGVGAGPNSDQNTFN